MRLAAPAQVAVDLMSGPGRVAGRRRTATLALTRGARIPPHERRAARRARGLEAAVVDNSLLDVTALAPADARSHSVRVAGTAARLVAKLHKLAERVGSVHRLNDKDAHDIYRVLVAIETDELVTAFGVVLEDKSAPTSRMWR